MPCVFQRIEFKIVSIDIEKQSNCKSNCCNHDSLTIYGGPDVYATRIIQRCGTKAPPGAFSAPSSTAIVVFKTNEDVTEEGFYLTYKVIEQPTQPPPGENFKQCN